MSPSYFDTGSNDFSAGKAVQNNSNMIASTSTTSGMTAADTTWSGACTGF